MTVLIASFVIHVSNVWQTAEWYRQVFDFKATIAPNAGSAQLDVTGHLLTFVSHDAQAENFGPRRFNSFLSDPAAFHLDMATAEVQQLFDHALTHGAVPVLDPAPDAQGRLIATLRDLNGVLIQLTQLLPLPQETSN